MAVIAPWGDVVQMEQLRHLGLGHGSSGPLQLRALGVFWPKHLWSISIVADVLYWVYILVMTVVFVLLKSSDVCLQGACEMTVTISTESPLSSYQFFDLKWPERPVECPTSGISKQILLVGSQYSWHCGKTCSNNIRGTFTSSLWVEGLHFGYEKMQLCGARTSL